MLSSLMILWVSLAQLSSSHFRRGINSSYSCNHVVADAGIMCELDLAACSKYLFSSPFWHISSNGWSRWGMISHVSFSIELLYVGILGFFTACQAQSIFPRCIFQKSNTETTGFLWCGSGSHVGSTPLPYSISPKWAWGLAQIQGGRDYTGV